MKVGGAKDARKVEARMSQGAKLHSDEVPERAVLPREADPYGWVERAVWTERMLDALRGGGPDGGRWYWLHDKVFAEKTLRAAFARVARNGGSPGGDGKTIEAFGNHLDEEIARLRAAWKAGTYRPQAIRRAWIPKPGRDEQRPLGIPTVRDRVVQTALKLVLEPIFESTFSNHSHGFRPGRSTRDALVAVLSHLEAGKVWVVDVDLKAYFDGIPHERLLAVVRHKVTDRRLLDLIGAFLKAGVLDEAESTSPEAGTPQGGVISPLLANIYLNDLDHEMAQDGTAMERYADDFVICCRTQEEAERALAKVEEWATQVGLSLHPAKTRVVDLGEPGEYVDFLGYRLQRHIDRHGRNRILRKVRPQSVDRIMDEIRQRTPRKSGVSLAEQIARLNPVLRGWFGYFRSATQPTHAALDKMVRRRLRHMLCKRVGWKMTWERGEANKRWSKTFFAEQGLFSLEEASAQYVHAFQRAH
jgi:RNA-directed DNA polymerase